MKNIFLIFATVLVCSFSLDVVFAEESSESEAEESSSSEESPENESAETQEPERNNNNIYGRNCFPRSVGCEPTILPLGIHRMCVSGAEPSLVAKDGTCYVEDNAPRNKIKNGGKWICYANPSREYYNCQKGRYYNQELTEKEKEECNSQRRTMQATQAPCGV